MSTVNQNPIEIQLASIGESQRQKNFDVLQPILTDLIAYSGAIKQLHWNVVGPHFRSIHLQLDDIYATAQEAVDTVAERIVACGHSPTGTLQFVSKNTEIKDPEPGFTRDSEVLLEASYSTRKLIGLIRSRMDEIEDIDAVTADILHQLVASLEKHHWMLEAQRV